jgi:hypothetical protein
MWCDNRINNTSIFFEMKTLTMSELEKLGFEVIKCYTHDHFITQRRKKGYITVETTWNINNDHKACSQDITIDEVHIEKFTFHELNILDLIINKSI